MFSENNITEFDEKTKQQLGYYVYCLINPTSGKPFYVGKGKDNRVFEHVRMVLSSPNKNDKFEEIKSIKDQGLNVDHRIVKHGLSEEEAFKIESCLIDFLVFFEIGLTNQVLGHDAQNFGIMTTEEVVGLYNATPLQQLHHEVVIININKSYERAMGSKSIYSVTKEAWVISESKRKTLEFALAEYRGIIIAVYKINDWYRCNREGLKFVRWGFNGCEADEKIKELYLNKSVAHVKKKGASNPIRYKLF